MAIAAHVERWHCGPEGKRRFLLSIDGEDLVVEVVEALPSAKPHAAVAPAPLITKG